MCISLHAIYISIKQIINVKLNQISITDCSVNRSDNQAMVRERILNKAIFYPSLILFIIGVAFTAWEILFPFNLLNRELVFYFTGFMTSFGSLTFVEYFDSSKNRAESERKARRLEGPLEEKQRDAALIGVVSSGVLLKYPIEEKLRYMVVGALRRLDINQENFDDFEKFCNNFDDEIAEKESLTDAYLRFLAMLSLSASKGMGDICNLSMRAFAIFFFGTQLSKGMAHKEISKADLENMHQLVGTIDVYNENYELVKDELVGEFKEDVVRITGNISRLRTILLKAQHEVSVKDTSKLDADLVEMRKEIKNIEENVTELISR
ncbi:Uncharacterised protein [uncultured archaeon]|nr:Uncharacterised protein [uncultured archaeon]